MCYKSNNRQNVCLRPMLKNILLLKYPYNIKQTKKPPKNITTKAHSAGLDKKTITSMLTRKGNALKKAQEKREDGCLSNRTLWH